MERNLTTEEFAGLLWQSFCEAEGISLSGGRDDEDRLRMSKGGDKVLRGGRDGEVLVRMSEFGVDRRTEEADLRSCTDGMHAGASHGWLNARDLAEAGQTVSRSAVARLLHEFMRRELGEQDVEFGSASRGLRDLYDCRTCVNHVAQVVEKGIMSPVSPGIFGMREPVTLSEAREMIQGLLSPQRRERVRGREAGSFGRVQGRGAVDFGRTSPADREATQEGPEKAGVFRTQEQALELLREHPEALYIDVRTPWEFENGHSGNAVNIPLLQLLKDGETVCGDRERYIMLECDGGYRSRAAAQCLADHGFAHVYYTAGEWEQSRA